MKTPLAILNLWHQQAKTLVSIGGVAFALLLVFMQLGFMGAVSHTATNVLENLRFDILVRARDYLHLYEPSQFDRKWLQVAASTRGVIAAKPLWITIHNWRKLPTEAESQSSDFESQYLPIAVMAFATQDDVFKLESVTSQQSQLNSGREVLLDQSTQRDYGPWNGRKFGDTDIGRETEIGGQTFSIGGVFNLGTGLAANGAAIASQQGFARIIPWNVDRNTSLGLIDIDADSDVHDVVAELRERFQVGTAEDESLAVDVLSRTEAMDRERTRWLFQTPIGLIFQLGVVISLLVGAAIVYMVLATDVANRLPEYATLLAMGYSRKYLAGIVMTQAIALCLCGFLVAWSAAELLYRLTSNLSGIPVAMNAERVVSVLAMGLAMSCCSGLLALRKLWKAEPASLF
jgi:putative ABC transport system permease protein